MAHVGGGGVALSARAPSARQNVPHNMFFLSPTLLCATPAARASSSTTPAHSKRRTKARFAHNLLCALSPSPRIFTRRGNKTDTRPAKSRENGSIDPKIVFLCFSHFRRVFSGKCSAIEGQEKHNTYRETIHVVCCYCWTRQERRNKRTSVLAVFLQQKTHRNDTAQQSCTQ